jgi:hypothetical protein
MLPPPPLPQQKLRTFKNHNHSLISFYLAQQFNIFFAVEKIHFFKYLFCCSLDYAVRDGPTIRCALAVTSRLFTAAECLHL